jgi:V8-like Glu-specific endopeptidase
MATPRMAWLMYEVTNRTSAPYSSVCYIVCEWSDGSFTRASGVIVGLNDVLTAHHVVYDATRGGYATHITISPGADTAPYSFPYGSFNDVGVIYARTPNWDADGDGLLYAVESQYDLALLGMRSSAISSGAGWLPVSNGSTDFSGRIEGYPARGTGLMEETVFADASSGYGVFDIASSLGPGGSGGPLMRTDATGDYVLGVLSSGNGDYTHSTYAGLFGPGNWTWLTNALEANNSVMGGSGGGVPLSGAAAGAITYLGTGGADGLLGTAADESLRGAEGNDALNGMAGTDTALYAGPRASYRLGHADSGITVTDTQVGRDGSDRLWNMEHAVFSDMSVNLGIGALSQTLGAYEVKTLEELYLAFFNRVPEADGLAFWMAQTRAGQTIDQTADAFYAAALLYPSLTGYTAGMGNADFVNVVYRNVLGRTEGADAQGLAFWSGALADGSETRGSLVTTILYSAHTFKGDATWGWVADLLDNKGYVAQHFAVEMGLGYNTPAASIAHGTQIAAAVTATDTSSAIALIGVNDGFSTLA